MSTFTLGTRVKLTGEIFGISKLGPSEDDINLLIRLDDGTQMWCKPSECRKLKPKKRRLRIWISAEFIGGMGQISPTPKEGWMRFKHDPEEHT